MDRIDCLIVGDPSAGTFEFTLAVIIVASNGANAFFSRPVRRRSRLFCRLEFFALRAFPQTGLLYSHWIRVSLMLGALRCPEDEDP